LLADLRYEQGEKAEAAREYEAVLRLGAQEAEVLKRLAGLYRDLGNGEAEEHALGQLVPLEKNSPDASVRLAELAQARGSDEEAEGQLLEANHRAPQNAGILLRLARVQAKREELREARESYLAAQSAEGEKPAELAGELDALTARFKLPKKPIRGTVDEISWFVSQNLNALYTERLKDKPELRGSLKVRTKVDASGKATQVELAMDTVGDPVIAGHVYFALKDAVYPKASKPLREPLFEFDLKPPKK
jgi:tetratricopeptide (TPR) repeat protein